MSESDKLATLESVLRDWDAGDCHDGDLTLAYLEAILAPGSTARAIALLSKEPRVHKRLAELLHYALDGLPLETINGGTNYTSTPIAYALTGESRSMIADWLSSRT